MEGGDRMRMGHASTRSLAAMGRGLRSSCVATRVIGKEGGASNGWISFVRVDLRSCTFRGDKEPFCVSSPPHSNLVSVNKEAVIHLDAGGVVFSRRDTRGFYLEIGLGTDYRRASNRVEADKGGSFS